MRMMLNIRLLTHILAVFFISSCEKVVEDPPVPSEGKVLSLYAQGFPNQGVINQGTLEVVLFAPFESDMSYPVHFSLTEGASSDPASGTSFPVGSHRIIVTGADGEKRIYMLHMESRDRTALLIIDLQNANFPVFDQDALFETINYLHEKSSQCEAVTIFIQHTQIREFEEGTYTWQIHSKVKPEEEDIILQKSTIPAMTPEVVDTLHAMGIHRLVITGTLTELCISESIEPAWNLGFHLVVPRKGHSTNKSDPEKIISDFYNKYRKYMEVLDVEAVSLRARTPRSSSAS
jgi:nicotinamidase-related amidase